MLFMLSITLYKIVKIAQYGFDFSNEIYVTIYTLPVVFSEVIQNEPDYI